MTSAEREKSKISIWDHLVDLKKMLLRIVVSWIIGIIITVIFREKVFSFYTDPVGDTVLHFMQVSEAMFFNMRIHMFTGFIFASPLIVLSIWKFVSPALKANERRSSVWYFIVTFFLSLFAVIYGYYYMMPVALRFLLGIGLGLSGFEVSVSASNYFNFFVRLFGILILIFQMPVLVFAITRFKVVSVDILRKYKKEVYFGLMAVVFAVAPGDATISGSLLLPIIIFYEAALWLSEMSLKREAKRKGVSYKEFVGSSQDTDDQDHGESADDYKDEVTKTVILPSSTKNTTNTGESKKFHL